MNERLTARMCAKCGHGQDQRRGGLAAYSPVVKFARERGERLAIPDGHYLHLGCARRLQSPRYHMSPFNGPHDPAARRPSPEQEPVERVAMFVRQGLSVDFLSPADVRARIHSAIGSDLAAMDCGQDRTASLGIALVCEALLARIEALEAAAAPPSGGQEET